MGTQANSSQASDDATWVWTGSRANVNATGQRP